ncbi:UNVERIFIED_CONTAM: hypothetical protein FKN15_076423 [Acipenser sinensis]
MAVSRRTRQRTNTNKNTSQSIVISDSESEDSESLLRSSSGPQCLQSGKQSPILLLGSQDVAGSCQEMSSLTCSQSPLTFSPLRSPLPSVNQDSPYPKSPTFPKRKNEGNRLRRTFSRRDMVHRNRADGGESSSADLSSGDGRGKQGSTPPQEPETSWHCAAAPQEDSNTPLSCLLTQVATEGAGSMPRGEGAVHYYWGVPFCPQGLNPDDYTKVILCQLEVYEKSLKQAQRGLLRKVEWGEPVLTGPPETPPSRRTRLSRLSKGAGKSRSFQGSQSLRDSEQEGEEEESSQQDKEGRERREEEEQQEEETSNSQQQAVSIFSSDQSRRHNADLAEPEAQLTATTPALTRKGEDGHTLSSEACALSRQLFFTLQTHHAATSELQRLRTTQLWAVYRQARRCPASIQALLVHETQLSEESSQPLLKDSPARTRSQEDVVEKPGSAPVSQRAQRVECPICMQSFPQNRIEMHAAYCDGTRESEELVVEEEEETASQVMSLRRSIRKADSSDAAEPSPSCSDRSAQKEKCYICQDWISVKEYHSHVDICIRRGRNCKSKKLLAALEHSERKDSDFITKIGKILTARNHSFLLHGREHWLGAPCCARGTYAFYKSFSCRGAVAARCPAVWSLGEFYFVRCGPKEPVCLAELTLLWEDQAQHHLLASSRLYFLPEDTPKGRSGEHGEDEVLAVSKKIVIRVEDLVKWACPEPSGWKRSVRKDGAPDSIGILLSDQPQGASVQSKDSAQGVSVKVLSYLQYCRFRSMHKRMQGVAHASSLKDPQLLALGGIRLFIRLAVFLFLIHILCFFSFVSSVDLFLLYSVVKTMGGYETVTEQKLWKHVYNELGGSPGSTALPTCTRRHYERYDPGSNISTSVTLDPAQLLRSDGITQSQVPWAAGSSFLLLFLPLFRLILAYDRYLKGAEQPAPLPKPRAGAAADEKGKPVKRTAAQPPQKAKKDPVVVKQESRVEVRVNGRQKRARRRAGSTSKDSSKQSVRKEQGQGREPDSSAGVRIQDQQTSSSPALGVLALGLQDDSIPPLAALQKLHPAVGGFSLPQGLSPLDVLRSRLGLGPSSEGPGSVSQEPRKTLVLLQPTAGDPGKEPGDPNPALKPHGAPLAAGQGRFPMAPLRIIPLDIDCSLQVQQLMKSSLGQAQLSCFTKKLSEALAQDLSKTPRPMESVPNTEEQQAVPLNLSKRAQVKRPADCAEPPPPSPYQPSLLHSSYPLYTPQPSQAGTAKKLKTEPGPQEQAPAGGQNGRLGSNPAEAEEQPADLSSPIRARAALRDGEERADELGLNLVSRPTSVMLIPQGDAPSDTQKTREPTAISAMSEDRLSAGDPCTGSPALQRALPTRPSSRGSVVAGSEEQGGASPAAYPLYHFRGRQVHLGESGADCLKQVSSEMSALLSTASGALQTQHSWALAPHGR